MSWFRPVRSLIGRESGRTFVCGARTNLKLKTDSSLGPIVVQICSSCITEGLSPDILWNERDTGKCSLTRIMGENGESFRPGTLSVSVGGIHGAARHAEISKKCEALGQLAEGIFVSENFAVALVTYRSNRCHVYGIGFGDNFPTGSKIKLADLPFDAVDGRFEVERSQPVSLADFDRGLCDQMKMAVDSFITDVDFFLIDSSSEERMQTSAGDRGKAQSIFRSVFVELGVKWIGPKYDFNLDVYEARIESGMMKGRSLSIPYERLQDSDVSAESIKQDLLTQLK